MINNFIHPFCFDDIVQHECFVLGIIDFNRGMPVQQMLECCGSDDLVSFYQSGYYYARSYFKRNHTKVRVLHR